MAIRWKYADRRNLQKVIASYNARITREINQNPQAVFYAPAKVTYDDIRSKINTRADYNRLVNSLKRIHQKGALEPVNSGNGELQSKYAVKEARILTNATNRRIKNYFKKVSTESTARREIAETNLFIKPFSFQGMPQGSFERFVESMEKQMRRIQNPQDIDKNYFYQYLQNMKVLLGLSDNDELYQFVYNMPIEAVSTARFENPFLSITAMYDPVDMAELPEIIYEQWADWWGKNKGRFNR